jgi:hypothetical protein
MAKKTITVPQSQNDVLLWIPEKELFFKIQPGTGENLDADDLEAGFNDYFIWNTFRVDELGFDGELETECEDSGMFMVKTAYEPTESVIEDCLEQAFGKVPKYLTLLVKPD